MGRLSVVVALAILFSGAAARDYASINSDDGYDEINPNDCGPVTVYCDTALGADYYVCDGCDTFNSYDDATGCPSGMEPVIPRNRKHWARSVVVVRTYNDGRCGSSSSYPTSWPNGHLRPCWLLPPPPSCSPNHRNDHSRRSFISDWRNLLVLGAYLAAWCGGAVSTGSILLNSQRTRRCPGLVIKTTQLWATIALLFCAPPCTASVNFACDPCIDRSDVRIKVIWHGTGRDFFWQAVKSAAQTAESDLGIHLDLSLYEDFDTSQMAEDIAAIADMEMPPDALIVTIPSDDVHAAISTVVADGVPVFGCNSGYDVAERLGLMGFVGMHEYRNTKVASLLPTNSSNRSEIRAQRFVRYTRLGTPLWTTVAEDST